MADVGTGVRRGVAAAALVALGLAAIAGYLVYPTEPNYDSMYSVLWAREILDGTRSPSLDAYRAPTQHPLAIAAALALVALGAPAHAFVALTLAAYVALVAGLVRLGGVTLGLLAGIVAALLLLTRLNFAFLAAFGYVDVPFLALLVWAAVLVAGGGREARGRPAVWALLVAAGLLRPEAWAFAALYAAWGWRGARAPQRAAAVALALAAPLLWALSDLVLTGDPLFSWTYTTDFAATLGRNRSLLDLPQSTLSSALEFVKAPVLAAGLAGIALALWRRPRRAAVPLVLTAGGLATFVIISQQGFSVIPRYFAITAVGLFLFAAHVLTGWELEARGSRVRRAWAAGAAVAAVAAATFSALTLNPAKVDADLRLREHVFADLDRLLADPELRAARHCGPISLPNHKLVPFVRWRTGAGRDGVIARSDRSAAARAARGGIAIVVRDIPGIRAHPAFGPRGSDADPPAILPAPPGFALVAQTSALTGWARCPAGM